MHNSELYGVPKACHNNLDIQHGNISSSTSKYVYVKQSLLTPNFGESSSVISKVLVNPQFNKTVFVNPNFNKNAVPKIPTITVPKIHINPRIQNIQVNVKDCTSVQKIHVNPNILRNIPVTSNNLKLENVREARTNCGPMRNSNSSIYSTKAQPSDTSMKSTVVESKLKKRRSSVRSKFKIIRSCVFENSLERKDNKRRASIQSKCRIITSKSSSQNYSQIMSCKNRKSLSNKFKLDNRNIHKASALPYRNRKYVYVNRFLSISDIARNNLFKHNGANKKSTLINISGILYKKSPNSLKRTTNSYKKSNDVKKDGENMVSKSKFMFIKKSANEKATEETRILKHSKPLRTNKNKKPSPRKLRKCNIPCPYYRKFGRCKGNENGKCFRKHDPDQIALCTKFLQGACVDKKCLLSHNVSPEKMPICKFYLEGACSREDCPYLHVRISPKADICKDFLEGFCKKASQCDKRHQFLCPDYEKAGSCLKQRCPYPHGKMVRKYSVFNKNKFAKKSSDGCKKETENSDKRKESNILFNKDFPSSESSDNLKPNRNCEVNVKNRYYVDQNTLDEDKHQEVSVNDQNSENDVVICDQVTGVKSRPKLGKLPSFIAFEEV